MTAKKIEPRQFSKIQVQVWQKLVASRRRLKVLAFGKEWQFQFVLTIGRKESALLSYPIVADIRLGTHSGTIRCALLPSGRWLSELLRTPTIETIQEPFRTAIVGVILQDFFQGLSQSSHLPLHLEPHSEASQQGLSLYWQMLNNQGEVEIVGSLSAADEIMAQICNAATNWPSLPWRLPDAFQISVEVLIDSLPFRKDTFLELGDIFLLGEFEKWKQESLMIRIRHGTGAGSLIPIKPSRSALENAISSIRRPHQSNPDPGQAETDTAAHPLAVKDMVEAQQKNQASEGEETPWMDSVEVILEFSLGHHTMSLGELRRIGQGHVFPIQPPTKGLVNILVQGQNIGQGELVKVGEEVGILVRELGDLKSMQQ